MNLNDKKYGIFMQVTPPTMLTEERWKKIDEVEYKDIDWRMQLIREGNPGKRFKVEELPEATEFTMTSEDKEVNGKSLKDMIAQIKELQPRVIPDNIPFILDLIPGLLPSDLDKKNEEGFSHLVKQLKTLTEKGLANPDKDIFGGLGDVIKNWPTMPKSEEFKGFMPGLISDLGWITSKDNPFRLAVDKETDNDPSKLTINVRKVRKPEVDEKKELEAIRSMMEWSKERLARHGRDWENQARQHSGRAVELEKKNNSLTEKLTQTQFEKEALEKKNALLLEKMDDMFHELLAYRIEDAIQETEDKLRATYFVEPAEDNR